MSLLISGQYQKEDLLIGACHCPPEKQQPPTILWLTIPLFAAILCSLCIHGMVVIGILNLSSPRKPTKSQVLSDYTVNLIKMTTSENLLNDSPAVIIPEKPQPVSIESTLSSAPVVPEPVAAKIDNIPPPAPFQKTVATVKSPVLSSTKKPVSKAIDSKINGIEVPKNPLPVMTNNSSVTMAETAEPIPQETAALNSGRKSEDLTTLHDPGKDISDSQQFREKHLEDIGAKVIAVLQYPAMAKRLNWQGQAHIGFLLLPSGEVTNFVVEKSSGFPILDTQAVAAVQAAAPFIGPAKQLSITLPVRFQLDRQSSKN
jgi:protein TonB